MVLQNAAREGSTWTVNDLRCFLYGSARFRWIRAIRITQPRDLTNFGDVR